MPNLLKIDADTKTAITNEVAHTFGRHIVSSRDCVLLAEQIFEKTKEQISPNTLRRFFGIVKANYPPSLGTCRILARYCGFNDVQELLKLRRSKQTEAIFCHTSVLQYLVNLFKVVPTREYYDETFFAMVKETINFLQQHPELFDDFQRAIARTKNGQEFYFEQFVNIDGLNSFYGNGLRYYANEKATLEARIFSHSLLCLRAWLTNDKEALKRHHAAVVSKKLEKGIHPFVCGRYFASQLFYAEAFGLDMEGILHHAYQVHSSSIPAKHQTTFPAFEYTISIALVLTGLHDHASFFIDHAEKYYLLDNKRDEGFYEMLYLIKAMGLFRRGKTAAAEALFNNINPSKFYFLSRKTCTIQYMALASWLSKDKLNPKEQAEALIEETGYVRLRPLFEENRVVKNKAHNS